MAYIRKTTTEYHIESLNGDQWDTESPETTIKDAIKQINIYRKNNPQNTYRIKRKRVKI